MKPLRVLIVEDSPADAILITNELCNSGYEPTTERVETAAEFEAALARGGWNLILSDHRLPDFTSETALQITQKYALDIPFIVISGIMSDNAILDALESGAHDFVSKNNLSLLRPVVLRELREAEMRQQKHIAEKALQESEALFRSLGTCSPLGMFLTNLDGKWSYANPKCREILGLKLPETLGDGWQQKLHPDDRAAVLRDWSKWQRESGNAPRRFRLQLGNNSVRWATVRFAPVQNSQQQITGYVGTIADITEQILAQEQLAASEQQFRDLFENSPDAIFVEDIHGIVLDANAAACRLHAMTHDQLIGKNVVDLVPPERRDEVARNFSQWFTTDMTYYDGFTYTSDGKAIPIEIRGSRFSYRKQAAILLQVRDVSERHRADDALKDTNRRLEEALKKLERSQQQLLQQERLRALGEMASGIAHDFNNALASILGFSELLLHSPHFLADTEKVKHYLQLINTSANDAAHVVSRLREFYRHREKGEVFGPVHLNQIGTHIISLTQPRWKTEAEAHGATIQIKTELLETPTIAANASDLREALTNLILNAVDAMPYGGTITLRTYRDRHHVVLEIADTGTGMTEEVRRRCLEPFFSTKGEHGTGLGLSVVYGILQRHGAGIDIQSSPGKGTTCILRFPITTAPPAAVSPVSTTSLRRLRILVIDDEAPVLQVVSEMLTTDGHHVTAASTGQEGLKKFADAKFDLVLVDRAMPGMSGDQVAVAIHTVAPDIPIVMLTGFGVLMNAAGEKPADVSFVVSKPITMDNLRQAIAEAAATIKRSNGN